MIRRPIGSFEYLRYIQKRGDKTAQRNRNFVKKFLQQETINIFAFGSHAVGSVAQGLNAFYGPLALDLLPQEVIVLSLGLFHNWGLMSVGMMPWFSGLMSSYLWLFCLAALGYNNHFLTLQVCYLGSHDLMSVALLHNWGLIHGLLPCLQLLRKSIDSSKFFFFCMTEKIGGKTRSSQVIASELIAAREKKWLVHRVRSNAIYRALRSSIPAFNKLCAVLRDDVATERTAKHCCSPSHCYKFVSKEIGKYKRIQRDKYPFVVSGGDRQRRSEVEGRHGSFDSLMCFCYELFGLVVHSIVPISVA